jgi:hypothetical protein
MKLNRVMVDLKFQALDFHAACALPMDNGKLAMGNARSATSSCACTQRRGKFPMRNFTRAHDLLSIDYTLNPQGRRKACPLHIRVRETQRIFFKKQYSLFQKFWGQGGFCYSVNPCGQGVQPGQNGFLS